MILEYLGNIAYKGDRAAICGFLAGIEYDIKSIIESKKKVIILGCGENSYYAEKMLNEKGIEVYAFVDNSKKMQGVNLRGKIVQSPYEFFYDNDAYFIIAIADIMSARLQFMTHNIESYSIFFKERFHDFSYEDKVLHDTYMEAINEICFSNETVEDALPLNAWGDKGKIGITNWCLGSSLWSHWAYRWAKEYIEHTNTEKILEIGPGYGTMSLVLLKLYSHLQMDWIIFGEPDYVLNLNKKASGYEIGLQKLKIKYGNQINIVHGYIEEQNFEIEKKYDLIIMTEVFEHFALNPVNTVKKLADALTENGRLVLTTPNWGPTYIYQTWEDLPDASETSHERYMQLVQAGHVYQYTKDELSTIFEKAGLEIEDYKISDLNNHNFILKKK